MKVYEAVAETLSQLGDNTTFGLLLFVREPRGEEEAPVSPRTRLEGEPG